VDELAIRATLHHAKVTRAGLKALGQRGLPWTRKPSPMRPSRLKASRRQFLCASFFQTLQREAWLTLQPPTREVLHPEDQARPGFAPFTGREEDLVSLFRVAVTLRTVKFRGRQSHAAPS
jgi:hypothetical protein